LVIGLHEVLPEGAMGTVGLSFGSPTSGAGFDVSSTVAEIVGNLKNVETPWNTQLTALESQDTAISSLGTLFSNLTNDMSSLTDAEGILSEKMGSSSDTNVLSLTAANSSAVAGTHTVEVNSLAATSSGYLAEVTSSSATLSGQFTLQMGSGKSQTFVIGAGTASPGTTYTGSGATKLSDLASAINSSGVGITANVEGDASGTWLSLTSGTSGGAGNITVSNNLLAATGQVLGYSGTAGADASNSGAATKSTGTLAGIASADDLQGTLTIQVGGGTAISVTTAKVAAAEGGGETIGDIAAYLQANYSSQVDATTVNNSDGTVSLSLTSQTAGSAGTLAVNSNLIYTGSSTLGYTSAVTGVDASLTIDGKSNIHSASNTVANLIPGVTFQLLAPSASGAQVQVVIGNDNTDVESTVNQFVTDYNSLVSAMNTQDGNNSSGVPEPLFGSPTLSLLQQQVMNGVNTESPNGYLDPIKNASDPLTGSINISLAGGIPMDYSGVAGTDADAKTGAAATTSTGTLNPIDHATDTLSGSITIQVGDGTAQTVSMGDSSTPDTLAGLKQAINTANNGAGIGVTASIVTNSDGSSSLSLLSGTTGSAGTLTVTSSIADPTTQTIQVPTSSGTNTLAGLAGAINASHSGVMAKVVSSSTGSQLELVSYTEGSKGALTVTPSITDTKTSTTLTYNSGGSDINSLTTLGINVNNDGSLTLDATSLDSVLNSDYSGVVGFFQNAYGWGQTFSTMLTYSGTTAGTGILALASSSNSNIESTLNADMSKENAYISAQQTSLTAELNSANEIMQQLPSQLQGVNELYSAITGYNQNTGG
jgi:flagellar hook-associated protein 2